MFSDAVCFDKTFFIILVVIIMIIAICVVYSYQVYINNLKNIIANGNNCINRNNTNNTNNLNSNNFVSSPEYIDNADTNSSYSIGSIGSDNSNHSIEAIKQKYGYGNTPEYDRIRNIPITHPVQPGPVPVPVPGPGPGPVPFPIPGNYPLNLRNLVREYDTETLVNPFVAPTSRPPGYFFGPTLVNPLFNFPTQGIPDDYSYVGNLVETCLLHDKDRNKNKGEETEEEIKKNLDTNTSLLQLIGRQRYPNGNRYDYYALVPRGLGHIKVEVRSHRNHELYDGDEVEIPELGHKKYTFKKNPSYWKQFY